MRFTVFMILYLVRETAELGRIAFLDKIFTPLFALLFAILLAPAAGAFWGAWGEAPFVQVLLWSLCVFGATSTVIIFCWGMEVEAHSRLAASIWWVLAIGGYGVLAFIGVRFPPPFEIAVLVECLPFLTGLCLALPGTIAAVVVLILVSDGIQAWRREAALRPA